MTINQDSIRNHYQRTDISCVPMSVELILKLLQLMPIDDFSLQDDESKSGHSNWIRDGFRYPYTNPKVEFYREYKLSDPKYNISGITLEDRGPHFMENYFNPLFKTIDDELNNSRYVAISIKSGNNLWHMEVIYHKCNETIYNTITFYHNQEEPVLNKRDLKSIVTEMEGTDILTYQFIN